MLATCPVRAALLHRWVLREERWLAERFGAEYDAYAAEVPRYGVSPLPPISEPQWPGNYSADDSRLQVSARQCQFA